MRIAIVDDDERDLAQLHGIVDVYTAERGLPAKIDVFSSGGDFLRAFAPKKYDLVFFDNYIGNGLGIDVARKTRELDEAVEFVFVSMSPEFAVSGFEVRALHYLIKPATPNAIAQVFDRFWKRPAEPEPAMLEIMSEHRPLLIPIPSIRFIEVVGKTCFIRAQEDVAVTMSLDKLMELLPPNVFVRTHRSYVVRLDAIQSLEKNEFLLKGGGSVPIGRAYQNACKSAFIEYLTNQRRKS